MGEKLVAWRRADGQWVVQADRCPHRLAPMSDGFVSKDKSMIVCAYHGYGFCGKTGGCTRVPAAAGGVGSEAERRAKASRRAVLRTLPAREEAGVLFVWPDPYSQDAAADAAAAAPPPVPEELRGEKYAPLAGRWYERELPHSHDFFIENVLDAQHAPQAHSGVAGFDANKADRLQIKLVPGEDGTASTSISAKGFTLQTLMEDPGRRGSLIHFHAPCLVRYEPAPLDEEALKAQAAAAEEAEKKTNKNSGKAEARPGDPAGKLLTHLIFYSCPVRPGWSKLIGTSFIVDAETNEPSKAASIFTTALPVWLRHVLGHEFMAGDLYILSRAATQYAREGRKWRSSYWMPTSADVGIVALRRWMETFGGGSDVPVLPASAAGAGVLPGASQAAQAAANGGAITSGAEAGSTGFALPGVLAPSEAVLDAASREAILSRYEQHTKNCAACRQALERTRAAGKWSARAAAMALGAAVLVAAAAAQHAAAVLAAASAKAAASAGLAERAASALVGATAGLGGPMGVVSLLLLLAAGAWLVRSGAKRLEQAFISLPFDRASKAFL